MTDTEKERRVRSTKGWIPIAAVISFLSSGIISVAFLLPSHFASVSFSYGAFGLAIAVHFLSVGNTVYSVGSSLESEVLLEDAFYITRYGMLTGAGAVATFTSGALWILIGKGDNWKFFSGIGQRLASSEVSYQFLYILLCIGGVVISISIGFQSQYSRWYDEVYEEIEDEDGTPSFAS